MVSIDRSRIIKEAKSRVFVVTRLFDFVGYLHLINMDRRESDVLNDDKPFLHLTEVEVKDKTTQKKSKVPFAAINKSNVICVIPMGEKKIPGK